MTAKKTETKSRKLKPESASESDGIKDLLLTIGFPQHVYGYEYIMYSMDLILQEPHRLHHITKEIYPDVAKHFKTTPARVERAMRHSIQTAWTYGNMQMIYRIFGNSIRPDKIFPTNTQMLAGLYYYLRERSCA